MLPSFDHRALVAVIRCRIMISWDMLAKMLRDMLQDDGLKVASAPALAMAAWYVMFGNWIVAVYVNEEEEDVRKLV